MGMATAAADGVLKLIFQAANWALYADNTVTTPQTQVAVSLQTGDPGASGNMSTSEIGYTSSARVNVNRSSGGWAESAHTVNPVAAITFPAGTGGSGTASFFATGATGGGATAILFSGTVTPNIVCGNGITPQLTTASSISIQ